MERKILPNFQNDTEPIMWGTNFHQADISAGVRIIDLGKSTDLNAPNGSRDIPFQSQESKQDGRRHFVGF